MGLFGLGKRKASVTVHGNASFAEGTDGRYSKQARKNWRELQRKLDEVPLEPRTPEELQHYIEEKYGTAELDRQDERFKRAFVGVKAHLVALHAPELITTPEMKKPSHPPVSEEDPDYAKYMENKEIRWKEAVKVPPEKFPMHLHVYNLVIRQGSVPAAWLEVYLESDHAYLAFKEIPLEEDESYATRQAVKDIVNYFGAGPDDEDEENERYMQFCSVQ